MKKGFVLLLLALAVVVLISPGLIGRIAEESMDENLEFAATEAIAANLTGSSPSRVIRRIR